MENNCICYIYVKFVDLHIFGKLKNRKKKSIVVYFVAERYGKYMENYNK